MNKAVSPPRIAGRLPVRVLSRQPPLVLALLALPQAGHAQGIVRGAQEASAKATGLPARWAVWLAARSAPVSAARWVRSRACSGFRIAATAIAAATMTAIATSAAIGIHAQSPFAVRRRIALHSSGSQRQFFSR